MANESTDALMTFIQGSNGVQSESRAVLHPKDEELHDDFKRGHFFEIETFTLNADVSDEEGNDRNATGRAVPAGGNTTHHGTPQQSGGAGNAKMSRPHGKFSKYVSLGTPPPRENVEVQEITVTRQMDMASPILLESCLKVTPFTKAVIVKRKVTGAEHHQVFLRIEFTAPLITSVNWEDGETVKETLRFVCRNVTFTYRCQNDDGTLGKSIQREWKPQRSLVGGGKG
jgi:type VI protein secretion system component Hcp